MLFKIPIPFLQGNAFCVCSKSFIAMFLCVEGVLLIKTYYKKYNTLIMSDL